MTEQPKKKVKKSVPKKGGPSIAQSTRKRAQVPISVGKKKPTASTALPGKKITKTPQPKEVPVAAPSQNETPPAQASPIPPKQPAPQPVPKAVPQPIPQASIPQPTPAPQPVPSAAASAPPPIVPLDKPVAAAPTPIQKNVIPLGKAQENSVHEPTQAQLPAAAAKKKNNSDTSQNKVTMGKPIQNESEGLKEEVASYLEVCDSCLSENNSPKDIVDVLHMLVRSLNFDVVTIAVLDEKMEGLSTDIANRGYNNPPNKDVVECWEKAVVKGKGIDWKILMKVAGDTNTELAYWVVQEELDSIGYVPIRDNNTIYGLIFVASMEKKTQSQLSSLLLDACGSRIGITYSLGMRKDNWPESVMNLAKDIRNQFSLLLGYQEMLKEASASNPELNDIIESCNKNIIESSQMLDSMISEAAGD